MLFILCFSPIELAVCWSTQRHHAFFFLSFFSWKFSVAKMRGTKKWAKNLPIKRIKLKPQTSKIFPLLCYVELFIFEIKVERKQRKKIDGNQREWSSYRKIPVGEGKGLRERLRVYNGSIQAIYASIWKSMPWARWRGREGGERRCMHTGKWK